LNVVGWLVQMVVVVGHLLHGHRASLNRSLSCSMSGAPMFQPRRLPNTTCLRAACTERHCLPNRETYR
jgi:hypothetical protein